MAGEAKTSSFLLSTATVCIGPTADLFNLNPAAHSIGLVKNVQVTAEPTYLPLKQGVKQSLVYSVMTDNPVRVQMEVYEYTGKNLAYALGLDGSSLSSQNKYNLGSNITGPSTSVSVTASSNPGWAVGDFIMIQENKSDKVHVGKIATYSYTNPTATIALTTATQVPSGVNFTAAQSRVSKLNLANVGDKSDQPFFSAKIIGILPEDSTPVVIMFPKIRITRGFTVAFTSDNYGNMPFEFEPYELVSTDTFYNEFGSVGRVFSVF